MFRLLAAGLLQGFTHAINLQERPVYTPVDAMASSQYASCCMGCDICPINSQGDVISFANDYIGALYGPNAEALSSLAMAVTGANESECQSHKTWTGCASCWQNRFCGRDWPETGATMAGLARVHNVAELIHYVHTEKVPGGFAELGVWRGGLCIFAHHAFRALDKDTQRSVHVFDAFDKMPGYGEHQDFLMNSEASVLKTFKQFGANDPSIKFHVGLFKDTTKKFRADHKVGDEGIAILRIDGNFYDSYQDAMYDLYEYVPVGGFVIWDDYFSHHVVRQFWTDFKTDQGLPENFVRIDANSAFFRKAADITLDQSKKKPPRDANL